MSRESWQLQEDVEIARLMREVEDRQAIVKRLRATGHHAAAAGAEKMLEFMSDVLARRRAQLVIQRVALEMRRPRPTVDAAKH